MIEETPYYRMARDEDGRVPRIEQRAFTMALRWKPPMAFGSGIGTQAIVTLRRLSEGDDVSKRHMLSALSYLDAAMIHYRYEREPDPYPGRNQEAADDLLALYELLAPVVLPEVVGSPA